MPRGVPKLGRRLTPAPASSWGPVRGRRPDPPPPAWQKTGVLAADWYARHAMNGRAIIEGTAANPVVWLARVRADEKSAPALVDEQGRVFMLCFADYEHASEVAPTWEVQRYPHLATQKRQTNAERAEQLTLPDAAATTTAEVTA